MILYSGEKVRCPLSDTYTGCPCSPNQYPNQYHRAMDVSHLDAQMTEALNAMWWR
jgi:hypothetical protein